MKNIRSKSRRKTPWSDVPELTSLQSFIDECNQENYFKKHPALSDSGETELCNSFELNECRHCSSSRIQRYGTTKNGIRRYRCSDCGKTFTVLTNTIFDSHKIAISEWLDFLLSVIGYGSFTLVSKSNRNAFNTTRYWIEKVFLVLREYQASIVLSEECQLDETYYKVRNPDIVLKPDGKQYRGISRNQICIGIACDTRNVVCFELGNGKPTKSAVKDRMGPHIIKGTTLIHDMEKAHGSLVSDLELKSIIYNSKLLKKLPDSENPLNLVNQHCRLLQQFLGAHSGFMRDDIQDYLNLYSFISNPPRDKHLKVEKFMNLAFGCRILHRYRG